MSKEKFTPGPWKIGLNKSPWKKRKKVSQCRIEAANGIPVSQATHIQNNKERKANAALISAAPEMYAELKRHCALCMLQHPECERCDSCKTMEVLKKARGES